jgi:hypothetical protein
MSDGCTGWIDGWPTWMGGTGDEWRHCCATHDEVYASTSNLWDILVSDFALGWCVAQISIGMGITMLVGLLTIGAGYFIHTRNTYRPGSDKPDR